MLKLLLEKDKKEIKKEYAFRFLNVFLNIFIFILIVYTILTLSNYILVKAEYENTLKYSKQINDSALLQKQKDLEKEIKNINKKAELLGGEKQIPSEIVAELLSHRNDKIVINNINYSLEKIDVSGIANDRDGLISFVDNLNQSEIFEQTDLPVSNFTKNNNIPFSLSVLIKKE